MGTALAVGAVLLVAVVILLATQLQEGGEPRQSIPGGQVLPVAAVASAPERYLRERVMVRGRVARLGEAGFVLVGGRRSLTVLGPTGGPYPRVRRGDLLSVTGVLRPLEPREARRLAADPRLPSPGGRPVLVATSVGLGAPQSSPAEAVRP